MDEKDHVRARPGGEDLGGFSRVGLLRRGAPFVVLMLAGFLSVPLPPRSGQPVPLLAAAVVFAAVFTTAVAAPWERMPRWAQLLPMLGCLGVVALLRQAEGGAASAESPLALIPVFWCALYGTRSQLSVVIAGVTAIFVIPRVLVGGPSYPVEEWERAAIWGLTAMIVGLTVQGLVARIKRQAQQLEELAGTDALTGVANRRTWDDSLIREVERAKRSNEPLVLGLLDLNGFKRFNDVHGHPAADRLLKEMTSAWTSALRTTDVLARIGGDEFGLLLPGLTIAEAQAVVERLGELMPAGQTFAAGLIQTEGSDSVEDLLTRADESLYRSKGAAAPRPLTRIEL